MRFSRAKREKATKPITLKKFLDLKNELILNKKNISPKLTLHVNHLSLNVIKRQRPQTSRESIEKSNEVFPLKTQSNFLKRPLISIRNKNNKSSYRPVSTCPTLDMDSKSRENHSLVLMSKKYKNKIKNLKLSGCSTTVPSSNNTAKKTKKRLLNSNVFSNRKIKENSQDKIINNTFCSKREINLLNDPNSFVYMIYNYFKDINRSKGSNNGSIKEKLRQHMQYAWNKEKDVKKILNDMKSISVTRDERIQGYKIISANTFMDMKIKLDEI